ncbi:UDP-N-acetylmuramoylalanine--D-glutamate ligase [Spirochaetia bacterium]|nr:UDP-N-acetylmuramoylalanine--D-glutamate ligase [Spirochaetia bacterium]GHU35672.1 UDP-N-acetylmuramoylalanine--D-glutamate ligase [Spirochaetia bacterium]
MKNKYNGCSVLIMGLGLHGGGVECARYFSKAGATLIITDLRDEKTLLPSIEQLQSEGISARYVLGRHDVNDFKRADIVLKNPGVRADSLFLQSARRIESDISIFLAESPAHLFAVTGSKGKSTTAAALHHVLTEARRDAFLSGTAYLGGNSTISPLHFVDRLTPEDDVVLELSSWQLADLKNSPLLKPRAAIFTAILPDHLDRYRNMDEYVADKRILYRNQDSEDCTVAGADPWGKSFHAESHGRPICYSDEMLPSGISGGWLSGDLGYARLDSGEIIEIVPRNLLVPGTHQKKNLLAAALALLDTGVNPECIRNNLGTFTGIEHRLEFFYESDGIRFYNDSAATIPESAAAAVQAFSQPVILVCGGSDKKLDYNTLVQATVHAKAVILLAGTGTEMLTGLLKHAGIPYHGPFDSIDSAAQAGIECAVPGDVVILSPGCASFGMFLNEFDRGRQWKQAVQKYYT